ncbi:MAG: PH domain-containing protein [Gammaproteobacteria bacterium]|nr:PH domain-containing protein [Gammaproteobacteria bacterium]
MSYIEDSLSEGEEILSIFKLHWVTKLPMIFWIIFVITIPLAIWEWLKLRNTEMGATNKRVILKTGIISRHSDEMKISSIETVEIEQGIMGRILGFGTVKVTGKGISDLVFKKINDPIDVKRKIESIEQVKE